MPLTDYDKKKKLSTSGFNDSGSTIDKAQPVEMAGSDFTGVDGFESGSSQLGYESDSAFSIDSNGEIYGDNSLKMTASNESVSAGRGLNATVNSDGKIFRWFVKASSNTGTAVDNFEVALRDDAGGFTLTVTFNDGGNVEANGNAIQSSWNADDIYRVEAVIDFTNNSADVEIENKTAGGTNSVTGISANNKSNVDSILISQDTSSSGQVRDVFFDRLPYTPASEDSVNAGGYIGYDSSTVSGPADVGWYDGAGNLRDYEIENDGDVGSASNTFVIWGYGSRTRDGTLQDQIAYGNNSANTDRQNVTGTWGNSSQNSVIVQHLNGNAKDSTSNNFDGTINGATSVDSGQLDGAYQFDGSDDNIDLGDNSSFQPNQFTLIAWANSNIVAQQRIVDYFNFNGGGYQISFRDTDSDSSNEFLFAVDDGGGGGVDVQGSTALANNEWHNVSATYDTGSAELFVNGSSEASDTGNQYADGNVNWIIGKNNQGGTRTFDGEIDNVRFYSEVKDAAWHRAEFDASPKAGQVFFLQQAAESTGTTDNPGSIHQTNSAGVKVTTSAGVQKTEP